MGPVVSTLVLALGASANAGNAGSAVSGPRISVARAAEILFLPQHSRWGRRDLARAKRACGQAGAAVRVECLIAQRYRRDRRARRDALGLYRETGSVAGLLRAQWMNGGWRGRLRLVPHLPVRWARVQLRRVRTAFQQLAHVMAALRQRAKSPLRFRLRGLSLRFFRSVRRRTPSGYAWNWSVAVNVRGSLLTSVRGVRETMFHEVFHLNDSAHTDWSTRTLATLYTAIKQRCTRSRKKRRWLSTRCLRPFAPHRTKVTGGTYYAFHTGSDEREYAAELAVRYYDEQVAALKQRAVRRPFKCRNPTNRRAWDALVREFFGGVDLTPPC